MFRIAKTLVCFLFAATAVQSQITTSRVNVRVTGRGCSDLKEVYLVINEKDLQEQWVKLDPDGTCRWKADLGSGTISTGNALFSLRADSVRSDCQKAAANEQLSANLEFACCVRGALRNVSVKVDPPMPVTYARDVLPFAASRNRSIPCVEKGAFTGGRGEIRTTQLDGENIYLHFGPGPVIRKQAALGLLLDEVVEDGVRVLTRDNVVYRLIVQRAQGKSRSAPTLSSNAISVDIKKLGDLRLAEIEVIK